jgi:hypothetical protein
MTRQEIMKLSNDQLNMLIAEKFMGFTLEEGEGIYGRSEIVRTLAPELWDDKPNLVIKDENALTGQREIPKYSENMNKAMEVAETLNFFYLFRHNQLNKNQWECKLTAIDDNRSYYSLERTAPLAICRAAALAKLLEGSEDK